MKKTIIILGFVFILGFLLSSVVSYFQHQVYSLLKEPKSRYVWVINDTGISTKKVPIDYVGEDVVKFVSELPPERGNNIELYKHNHIYSCLVYGCDGLDCTICMDCGAKVK